MSLINDALKRAKQAQQDNPPPAAQNLQFRPVEPEPQRRIGPGMLLALAVVGVIAIATFFIWQGFQKRGPTQQTATAANASPPSEPAAVALPPAAAANPVANTRAPAVPAPTASTANTLVPASVAPAASSPPPATTQPPPATSATVAATGPAPPKPAGPKLQGILYRPGRPSALVSGEMVFIGDRVGEFRVAAIDKTSVTLMGAGQTNVLSLDR